MIRSWLRNNTFYCQTEQNKQNWIIGVYAYKCYNFFPNNFYCCFVFEFCDSILTKQNIFICTKEWKALITAASPWKKWFPLIRSWKQIHMMVLPSMSGQDGEILPALGTNQMARLLLNSVRSWTEKKIINFVGITKTRKIENCTALSYSIISTKSLRSNVSNMRNSVALAIQTLQISSKMHCCASYFQLCSRCLDISSQLKQKLRSKWRSNIFKIYMLIKTGYPDLLHGCDFLCFNLMNY